MTSQPQEGLKGQGIHCLNRGSLIFNGFWMHNHGILLTTYDSVRTVI